MGGVKEGTARWRIEVAEEVEGMSHGPPEIDEEPLF
jgi:hypothetical protein